MAEQDREDELRELQRRNPGAKRCEEGGTIFYYVPNLPLPPGCVPTQVDVLLCPTARDGYPSRLYFAQPIQGPVGRNWNTNNTHILGRNWFAFSWSGVADQSLANLVLAYVRALLP